MVVLPTYTQTGRRSGLHLTMVQEVDWTLTSWTESKVYGIRQVITYRREATGNASTQLGFTNNNNLYIRGNSGNSAVYSNWFKIWSASNDGAASGLDADVMDGKQGLWYQTGYNVGDTRGGITSPIGDMFLPEVLGKDKIVFENFYVNDTGNKFT